MKTKHQLYELQQKQSLSLPLKILMTKRRIKEWYEHWDGNVYISFSGGKDSTVLLHIVRSMYSEVPAVFCDTGLEYPEIRDFAKQFENVKVIRPVWYNSDSRKWEPTNFRSVLLKYGYPVVSKEVARRLYEIQNYNLSEEYRNKLLGDPNKDPSLSRKVIPKKWRPLIDSPFKISAKCCDIMKKNPFHLFEKESGLKPILATMAVESSMRTTSWLRYGCNSFDEKSRPMSRPMSFWMEQDVLNYIRTYNIPIASVYGDIVDMYNNNTLVTTGCERTGCMFCMFGCHLDTYPNRFQRMKETHPQQYSYCMKPVKDGGLGLDEVLTYIHVPH